MWNKVKKWLRENPAIAIMVAMFLGVIVFLAGWVPAAVAKAAGKVAVKLKGNGDSGATGGP